MTDRTLYRLEEALIAAVRFWKKVVARGPDECWTWTGATTPSGYGQMQFGNKKIMASRFSWMLANERPFPARP
jgi:hypothetical protein